LNTKPAHERWDCWVKPLNGSIKILQNITHETLFPTHVTFQERNS